MLKLQNMTHSCLWYHFNRWFIYHMTAFIHQVPTAIDEHASSFRELSAFSNKISCLSFPCHLIGPLRYFSTSVYLYSPLNFLVIITLTSTFSWHVPENLDCYFLMVLVGFNYPASSSLFFSEWKMCCIFLHNNIYLSSNFSYVR